MRRLSLFLAAFFLAALSFAQPNALQYEVSFPNAVHHEAQISLLVPQVPAGPLTVRMSRASPGRYATHEFGKNVYNLQAFDPQGQPLAVVRTQGDLFEIPDHPGTVRVTYTVFGNWVDGTYLGIDETHAHMNMPATFLWAVGLEERPIRVAFQDLDRYNWQVATQLKQEQPAHVFSAPNLQYFMDSPTELSAYRVASWTDVNPGGLRQTIRVATHAPDPQPVVAGFGQMLERMTKEAKTVFGELPAFEHGTYTFIHDVHPDNANDGMEHRNSTIITQTTPSIAGYEKSLLGTFSHEFFHAWNVERIRPQSLEPFDFTHANMSGELWFAEGFTQYYGNLLLRRAGLLTAAEYQATLASIVNTVLVSPGAQLYSAPHMSRQAVFTDAGTAVDQTNFNNTFTTYYNYGAAIALALDLRLRAEFNKTLDDYMRAVWVTHGKTEIPYTPADLEQVLAGLTNPAFAQDFFKRFVLGVEKADYAALLAKAGLVLRKAQPGQATLGPLQVALVEGRVRVEANTLRGTPAYAAGLGQGDYLLQIAGEALRSPQDVLRLTQKHQPGAEVEVVYLHRGNTKRATVTLQENPVLEVVAVESTGKAPPRKTRNFREAWLSTKVK